MILKARIFYEFIKLRGEIKQIIGKSGKIHWSLDG
jgi:hypothetical protein